MSLSDLLLHLSALPPETSLNDALRQLQPPPAAVAEAIRRCALPRWFDRNVYDFVCVGLNDKPDFESFVGRAEVNLLAPDRWGIEEAERSRQIAAWQSKPTEWKQWNQQLGEYFSGHSGSEARLDAVYHLAASPHPDEAEARFRGWFDEADRRFDLTQCNGLLEMLRIQHEWRGAALSQAWEECRQQYSSRLLFREDWYKTGAYLRRDEPLRRFREVLERKATDPWIFHIHATGGTGKTMFLRWLIAHELVPKRIPCARIDFNDFMLTEIVDYPLRLFDRIVDQLRKQQLGTALVSLQEKLARERGTPGWNPSVLDEVRRQWRGAGITGSLVVVLDTLEDVTLSAATWLYDCVEALRKLREPCPGLTLVLSGRYDIAARTTALRPGEFLAYELLRFSEPEAHAYLESRGIKPGPVRDAIVQRVGGDEDEPDDQSVPSRTLTRRNPFKLAMFAELALNRATLDADEVMRLPRIDIAYLIERVIKRIESQPVRWMVRYGAVARSLTRDFAEKVLLLPLLQALRGEQSDNPETGLDQDYLDQDYKDVWLPDSAAAEKLQKDGIADLWTSLSAYARDRGWLSSSTTVAGEEALRFHPDVIQPTRSLLRPQNVFPDLQRRAAQFFEEKGTIARSGTKPGKAELAPAVHNICEAIFHRFQLEGSAAEPYWLSKVRQIERFDPASAIGVAAEITGRDYAEAERVPYGGVSAATLIRAHCEVADLLLLDAQTEFVYGARWTEFSRRVDLALAVAERYPDDGAPVPALLRVLRDICRDTSVPISPAALTSALKAATTAREHAIVEMLLGRALAVARSPEAPLHYRQALQLLREADRTGFTATDVHLLLGVYYMFQGFHSAVLTAHRQAIETASDPDAQAKVLERQASYALDVGDGNAAARRIAELREVAGETGPSAVAVQVLQAQAELANLDPLAATAAARRGFELAVNARDRARCLDLEAEARAAALEYRSALELWDSASSQYDVAGVPTGSARCAVLAIRLRALSIGDLNGAATMLVSAQTLRGARDAQIYLELQLLGAYIAWRGGRHTEAVAVLHPATTRIDWPARLRARALMFGLCFGLLPPDDDSLEELQQLVSEIQPLTLRNSVFDWTEHADGAIRVPEDLVRRLIELLPRPQWEAGHGTQLLIRRADLYRVFGMQPEAEAVLRSASDTGLLANWHLNLARERLRVGTDFLSLLHRLDVTEAALTPLRDAVRLKAAREALQNGRPEITRELLQDGPGAFADGTPNTWQALYLETVTELSRPPSHAELRAEAAPHDRSFGAISFENYHQALLLEEKDVPPSLMEPEWVIDQLLGDLAGFVAAMGQALPLDAAFPIEVTGRPAMLPWELARPLLWRQSPRAPIRPERVSARRHGAVLLIVPAGGTEELTYAFTSGFSLARSYFGYDVEPEVYHPDGTGQYPPGSQGLYAALSFAQPALIHIVASVRESSSGVHLDFESTTERTVALTSADGLPNGQLNPFALDRALAILPQPPFILLDVARPHNFAETVRMLLLRNLFATHLFELGHVRGILGCGLGDRAERGELLQFIVPSLLDDTVRTPLRRSPAVFDNLEHVLAKGAMALWTNNPDDRLFEP